MLLKSFSLTNFRNYSKASFAFSPETTLVVGPNTSGKTNLLEAIYFLAAGKSFRAGFDREAIAQGEPFANLKSLSAVGGSNLDEGKELELQILANENGENTSSKRFKVNGVKKRLADFAGNLRAVYFGPEEIQLVTGPPSRRRKYLDSVLTQVDREYARTLLEYEKVLRQRNRLLILVREGEQDRSQLDFWDEKLVALGSRLTAGRGEFFETINNQLSSIGDLFLEYQPRAVDRAVLEKNRDREIAAGMTLWGPHREDFVFKIKERDLSIFGSRGEQRLAVLHLKLAELEFITQRAGERPVLLLDDIFSELDESNRGQVLKLLGRQQTIVTATELDQIDGEKLGQHKVISLTI